MLDLGWQEILVIGALSLIVVGPKDLPGLLRTLGQYAGKVRGMAREFQRTMDDAARESDLANLKELKDIGNDIREATRLDFETQGRKAAESLMNPKPPASPAGASAASATEDAAPPVAPSSVAPSAGAAPKPPRKKSTQKRSPPKPRSAKPRSRKPRAKSPAPARSGPVPGTAKA